MASTKSLAPVTRTYEFGQLLFRVDRNGTFRLVAIRPRSIRLSGFLIRHRAHLEIVSDAFNVGLDDSGRSVAGNMLGSY